jgi:serine/threonine protein phosphatase PrpC
MVKYNVFAASCIGANHIKAGTVCQDFSACYKDDNMALIAVADGHGSPLHFYSDRGARFACEAAIAEIKIYAKKILTSGDFSSGNLERSLFQLETAIYADWFFDVTHDWDRPKNPAANLPSDGSAQFDFTDTGYPEIAYGTTLLAACVTEDFFFALQIGDGRCMIQTQDGKWGQPVPWDERCFFNVTTSLCEPDAVDSFRHYYSREIPRIVFLGTDGVDNSFPLEDNELHLARLYNSIAATCVGEDIDACKKQVEEFLPQVTERGSGDDVSIAGSVVEE